MVENTGQQAKTRGKRGPKEDLHHRAYRFRIAETPEQARAFAQIAGCCRLVYNLALEQRRDHGRRYRAVVGRSVRERDQRDELPDLKMEAAFLSEAPSHCLQEAIHDLDRGFQNFFAGRAAYPKPRRRFESDAFRFPDPTHIRLDVKNGLLHLPKFGKSKGDHGSLKLLMHRRPQGRLRHVTIIRDGAHWYASLAMGFRKRRKKNVVAEKFRAGLPLCVLGADRGVTKPVALSEPVMVTPDAPGGSAGKFAPTPMETPFLGFEVETKQARARTRRLAQAIARKTKGSKNRLKAKKRLATHKARLARRRRDMLRKIAAAIMARADIVVLEALRVKAMTASAKGTLEEPGTNVSQKAGLNRGILDKGWGMLVVFLQEIAARDGKRIVFVNPKNTSRECAACGVIDGASREAQVFCCTACGHEDHADLNAAKVLVLRASDQIAALVAEIGSALIGEIASPASKSPVERRCQPVESSGSALSVKQENQTLEALPAQAQA